MKEEQDKKNFIVIQPGNISLIYAHLANQEIDPGLNASYNPEGTIKYFVNQDNPNDKNARFSIVDGHLIFTYFLKEGQTLSFSMIGNEPHFIGTGLVDPAKIREAIHFNLESRFFDFIREDFNRLNPAKIIGELWSYNQGFRISYPELTKFAYPVALLVKIFNTLPEERGLYHDILENRTSVNEQGVETPIKMNKLPQDLETAIQESFIDFYHDRYKHLFEEDSPEKKTRQELAQKMSETIRDVVTKPNKKVDVTDCLYFFRVLELNH